jgi:hypothetical protein
MAPGDMASEEASSWGLSLWNSLALFAPVGRGERCLGLSKRRASLSRSWPVHIFYFTREPTKLLDAPY